MHPEIAFLHKEVGPDPFEQFLFADNLAAFLEEDKKDVAGPTADAHWLAGVEQQLPRGIEIERLK